jgi:hypothetical protein
MASFSKKRNQFYCTECEKPFDAPNILSEPQTIFLSYAHKSENIEDYDVSEDLVWLIKDELEKDGHQVWIDYEGIRGGSQWRERITDAITSHRHFLAFLSKRSVRFDPNVCLNEVAIAIKHNRVIQTILTESEKSISAPLTLSSIQWHKFQDWKDIKDGTKKGPNGEDWLNWFNTLMTEIRQNLSDISHLQKQGELGELYQILMPSSFTADVIKSVEGFFGRKWLFDAYKNWLTTEDRIFWLKGSPGIGKSSFAAKLVHDGNSEVVGFFKCDFQGLKSAEESASECIRTLAYQLASRLPDYRIRLLRGQMLDRESIQKKTADDLFTYLITEPLNQAEKITESHKMLLVIDALDEAGRITNGVTINPLADLIYKHADKLPPWLGIVITSRPEASLQQQLGSKFTPLIVDGETNQNISDLRHYLSSFLNHISPQKEQQRIVDLILKKSGGIFLYIKRVEKNYDLSKPEDLPDGLDDLFFKDFKRYFPNPIQYDQMTERFLRLLVAAPGPLPKKLGIDILQWQERDLKINISEPMSSMLKETDEELQLYHKSLNDWLTDGLRSGIFQVNPTGGIELGDYLWNEFEQNYLISTPTKTSKVSKWEKHIINWLPDLLPSTHHWDKRESLDLFSAFLKHKGKFQQSLIVCERYHELTNNQYFNQPLEIAKSLEKLAWLINEIGIEYRGTPHYISNIEIMEEVVRIREKHLGIDHIDTILSVAKTRYGEAGFFERGHQAMARVLPFIDKLELENQLYVLRANAYYVYELGDLISAQSIFLKMFQIASSKLSIDKVLAGNLLGFIYYEIGDYKESLKISNESLSDVNKLSNNKENGFEHIYWSLYINIALANLRLNHKDEAKKYAYLGLDLYQRFNNEKNPWLSAMLVQVAIVEMSLENYREAETLLEKAYQVVNDHLGNQHSEISVSINALGCYKFKIGEVDAAQKYLSDALVIRKSTLPPGHRRISTTLENLAFIKNSQGLIPEASDLFDHALTQATLMGQNNLPQEMKARILMRKIVLDWKSNRKKETIENLQNLLSLETPFLNESKKDILSKILITLKEKTNVNE